MPEVMPASGAAIQAIETEPIRVLVERYPAIMPILNNYGMDLCCGGGHTVAEAATAHGLNVDTVIAEVLAAIG
jgi:regulator of cell morphogenesis and NO signaling